MVNHLVKVVSTKVVESFTKNLIKVDGKVNSYNFDHLQ